MHDCRGEQVWKSNRSKQAKVLKERNGRQVTLWKTWVPSDKVIGSPSVPDRVESTRRFPALICGVILYTNGPSRERERVDQKPCTEKNNPSCSVSRSDEKSSWRGIVTLRRSVVQSRLKITRWSERKRVNWKPLFLNHKTSKNGHTTMNKHQQEIIRWVMNEKYSSKGLVAVIEENSEPSLGVPGLTSQVLVVQRDCHDRTC